MGHGGERDQALPLLAGVPTRAVPPFGGGAERNTTCGLNGDGASGVRYDQVERGHVPRPHRLAEFVHRASLIHSQQRG